MSRKACFFMFVVMNIILNCIWFNNVDTWAIFAYQVWAVFCAYLTHYLCGKEVVS